MSLPKVIDVVGGYDYYWENENIRIECRRLTLHSQELKGEIVISSTSPGVSSGHLHQASFNFSSGVTRDRLASILNKRLEADWGAILEQVCVYTLEKFRRGESIIEINTDDGTATPPEFLIHPFIIRNYPTIIFGDPSSSKSLFALILSVLMILPWYDNPFEWAVPSKPIKILYLDWETDESTIRWSLSCIQRGMNLPPLFLNYLRCSSPLNYDIEQISGKVIESKAEVVIIDSLGLAAGGDLNLTEPALNFWTAWRKLKTTSLILAHTAKSEDKKKSVYGNVYYTAEARSIWEIKKSQEADSNEMDIALFHRKPAPFTRLHKPMGLHMEFKGDGEIDNKTIISGSSPQSIGEFLSALGTQAQIKDLLKDGIKTTQEIQDALSITNNNARVALKRLKDKNEIIKLDSGKWGLCII